MIPVIKPTGAIRLGGDFKVTLNPNLIVNPHSMPSIDDIQQQTSGCILFPKLDLFKAFAQTPLDHESKQYVPFSTHQGLYQYNCLSYGVACAPAIQLHALDETLRGIPCGMCYQDDIFITGKDHDSHLTTLTPVLKRLESNGRRANRSKCSLLQRLIVYLGHRNDKEGMHPTEDKVYAVKNAPAPKNVDELRSSLGLINYYQKFLPNLATVLIPFINCCKGCLGGGWVANVPRR